MSNILCDLTSDFIDVIYTEVNKKNNKKKVREIINNIIYFALDSINPYLYTIMGILILMFIMNCFQFYYYVKLFITNKNNHPMKLTN